MSEDYALYENDYPICVGKKYFIAFKTGISIKYLHVLSAPSRKYEKSKLKLIRLEEG